MNTTTISSLLKPMSSVEIIETLSTLESSGVNITSIDVPSILSSLNVTQIEGLLSSNSTTVNGLLQSLKPTQLVTIITNFQNVTSTLFQTGQAAALANETTVAETYITTGETLVSLLMNKINNVFTDSQILGVFSILSNGAALGTGSKKLISIAKNLISGFFGGVDVGSVSIPQRLLLMVEENQQATFGDYPRTRDIAPSSIFMVIFFFFSLIHLGIFLKNYSLGHRFLISLGLSFYSVIRFLGFLLRIVWAKDSLKIEVGLTSTIFLIIPTTFLPSLNLILAQRYFTWKHPVYGTHRIFTTFMYLLYALVVGVIVMTIIAAAVQTDHLLSAHHFEMTKNVIKASAFLIIIYSLIASILVAAAFVIPQSKLDSKVLTFQPYWIKSFKWNYFVEKGIAAKEATLVTEDQRSAISVINSSAYHHEAINKDESSTNDLDHSVSIVIIALTTLFLFIADVFRCVSTFIEQKELNHSWIFDPVVMYVMFGVLETFVNLLYILGRIDLRFYRPDGFPKHLPLKPEADEKNAEVSPAVSTGETEEEIKDTTSNNSTANDDELSKKQEIV